MQGSQEHFKGVTANILELYNDKIRLSQNCHATVVSAFGQLGQLVAWSLKEEQHLGRRGALHSMCETLFTVYHGDSRIRN